MSRATAIREAGIPAEDFACCIQCVGRWNFVWILWVKLFCANCPASSQRARCLAGVKSMIQFSQFHCIQFHAALNQEIDRLVISAALLEESGPVAAGVASRSFQRP